MGAMRLLPLSACLALTATLGACATTPPPPVPSAPSPTPTATATASALSEAPVRLVVGQATDLSRTRGLVKAVVTVDSITENATCPTGAATATLGQFVAVTISAERTDSAANFAPVVYDWATVDGAGTVHTTDAGLTTGLCLTDGTGLKLAYDADGKAHGTLLIDATQDVASITATNPLASPPVTMTLQMPPR